MLPRLHFLRPPDRLPAFLDQPGTGAFLAGRQIQPVGLVRVKNRLALARLAQSRFLRDGELPFLHRLKIAVLFQAFGFKALLQLVTLPVEMRLALDQFCGAAGQAAALRIERLQRPRLAVVDSLHSMPVPVDGFAFVRAQGAGFRAVALADFSRPPAMLGELVGLLLALPLRDISGGAAPGLAFLRRLPAGVGLALLVLLLLLGLPVRFALLLRLAFGFAPGVRVPALLGLLRTGGLAVVRLPLSGLAGFFLQPLAQGEGGAPFGCWVIRHWEKFLCDDAFRLISDGAGFQGMVAMPKFTVELTEQDARDAEETAAFFKMTLPEFLAEALSSGIFHAAEKKSDIESEMADPAGRTPEEVKERWAALRVDGERVRTAADAMRAQQVADGNADASHIGRDIARDDIPF